MKPSNWKIERLPKVVAEEKMGRRYLRGPKSTEKWEDGQWKQSQRWMENGRAG